MRPCFFPISTMGRIYAAPTKGVIAVGTRTPDRHGGLGQAPGPVRYRNPAYREDPQERLSIVIPGFGGT